MSSALKNMSNIQIGQNVTTTRRPRCDNYFSNVFPFLFLNREYNRVDRQRGRFLLVVFNPSTIAATAAATLLTTIREIYSTYMFIMSILRSRRIRENNNNNNGSRLVTVRRTRDHDDVSPTIINNVYMRPLFPLIRLSV